MIRTAATVVVMTFASLSLVGGAQAAGAANGTADGMGQFYATPIQKGAPTDLPGERLVPGASLAAQSIDLVVSPILVPVNQIGTGVGVTVAQVIPAEPAAAPAPAPAMARHHHHHHHHYTMKHRMMKKHM